MNIITKYLNINENNKYQTIVLFEEMEDSFFELLEKETSESICLITFSDCDWNKDFTPWKFDKFSGEGNLTIELVDAKLKELNIENNIIAIGYSLGGLMALYYASLNKNVNGVCSVSGSLWYPDLIDYLKDNMINNKRIYLSLGNKESKTKHPLMKTVDEKTKEVKELLSKSNDVYFEYNEGNHFFEADKRIIKGLKYLLK